MKKGMVYILMILLSSFVMTACGKGKNEDDLPNLAKMEASSDPNSTISTAADEPDLFSPSDLKPTAIGEITLGTAGWYLSDAVKEAIMDFNMRNPDSRIEIIEYGNKNYGSFDYDDGFLQLNADIVSGKCPDILLLPQEMSFGLYAQIGLFKDLYHYFASDDEFAWEDYQKNIIQAYETKGKLFGVPITFNVNALVGKAADLGGKKEWNLDELISFADRFPESRIISVPTKFNVLDLLLKANGENIIDWNGEGNGFNRDFFIKMLEFANRFVDDDRYSDDRHPADRIKNGDIRLTEWNTNVTGAQMAFDMFGEPVQYVGFPSEYGSGFLITSSIFVAISKNCQNNKTAWDFIMYLLSDEFQSREMLYGYPVKKSSFEKRIVQEKNPSVPDGMISGGNSTMVFATRDVTDEELKAFYEMIESANKIRVFDQQVDLIIVEEAGHFFSGKKTVAEVAAIVESRVGIFVKESK